MPNPLNVLVLGGTTEASALAGELAARTIPATLSYAGRVANPRTQPVPVRVGGFGGVQGLAHYVRDTGVTHLVDATHPFAATMSANAVHAAGLAGVPLIALTRPAWRPVSGDRWHMVADVEAAVLALAGPARRIFLATGRLHVQAFAAQPQHHYLLRFVDAPAVPPALPHHTLPHHTLPHHTLIVDRGPFDAAGDERLLRAHAIDVVVSKNAGGTGAEAKLIAARALGLPVILIDRPVILARREVYSVADVLRWLGHDADRGV